MRDHSKLKAFELADALALQVYRETAGFPREEQFWVEFSDATSGRIGTEQHR